MSTAVLLVAGISLALLPGCEPGDAGIVPDAPAVTAASVPPTASTGADALPKPGPDNPRVLVTTPKPDASARPELDGELALIDFNDPELWPQPGEWTMVSSTLSSNDCDLDPRTAREGPCTMGCGPASIRSVEPGVFTLETPAIGYTGTCVVLDRGERFVCEGGTGMPMATTKLRGRFGEGGVVDGEWTLVMSEAWSKPGCTMAGVFRAQPPDR